MSSDCIWGLIICWEKIMNMNRQHQNENSNSLEMTSVPALQSFTNPAILEIVGHTRTAKMLSRFHADLANAGLDLAELPDPESPSINLEYFHAVAQLLQRPELPESLRSTLAAMESAAAQESADGLDRAIQRRIPQISLNRECPLDCALELWFHAPEELDAFSDPSSMAVEGQAETASALPALDAPTSEVVLAQEHRLSSPDSAAISDSAAAL